MTVGRTMRNRVGLQCKTNSKLGGNDNRMRHRNFWAVVFNLSFYRVHFISLFVSFFVCCFLFLNYRSPHPLISCFYQKRKVAAHTGCVTKDKHVAEVYDDVSLSPSVLGVCVSCFFLVLSVGALVCCTS